jgi:hypothetical protein
MEEKNFHFDKLNNIEVVKESIQLYKENYKFFLKISFFIFLINLFNTSFPYIMNNYKENLMFIISPFILLLISLPLMYLGAKLSVALIFSISKYYINEPVSFQQAFQLSTERIWTYIGVSLLYGLILAPFILIEVAFYLFIKAVIIKWILILLLLIPTIYFLTVYGLAPIAAVLETKSTGYLKQCKSLVKDNLLRVALLLAIVSILTSLPGLLIGNFNPWFKSLSSLNQYILQVLHSILFMFITPLVSVINVVLYLTLKKKISTDDTIPEFATQNVFSTEHQ